MRTLSSTKTLPFFFPRGFSTPTGVIMFSFGKPSSFSVYTFRFFFFCGPVADFVFCCFGGGAFGFFDTRFLVLAPRALGLFEVLLPLLDLAGPVFFGGPLLGAMVRVRELCKNGLQSGVSRFQRPRSLSKRSRLFASRIYVSALTAKHPSSCTLGFMHPILSS